MYILDGIEDLEVLSKEQTNYYLKRVKENDENARKILIERNIKLVIYLANRYFHNLKLDEDDLIAYGTIGLIKSIDTFDLDKNIAFITYASRCIINEILMFLRREKKNSQNISLSTPIEFSSLKESVLLENLLPNKDINIEEDYEEKELFEIVNELVECLPEKEKRIITMFYGLNNTKRKSQSEIAREYGVCQSTIFKVISKSIKFINTKLERLELKEKNVLKRTLSNPK